jgi:hypothetical protein
MNKGMRLKTPVVWVGTNDRLQVFQGLEQVPPRLRKRVVRSTQSDEALTILIADKKGRNEIVRALRGEPAPSAKPAPVRQPAPRVEDPIPFVRSQWGREILIALLLAMAATFLYLALRS